MATTFTIDNGTPVSQRLQDKITDGWQQRDELRSGFSKEDLTEKLQSATERYTEQLEKRAQKAAVDLTKIQAREQQLEEERQVELQKLSGKLETAAARKEDIEREKVWKASSRRVSTVDLVGSSSLTAADCEAKLEAAATRRKEIEEGYLERLRQVDEKIKQTRQRREESQDTASAGAKLQETLDAAEARRVELEAEHIDRLKQHDAHVKQVQSRKQELAGTVPTQ